MMRRDDLLRWLACAGVRRPARDAAAAVIGFGHFDTRIPTRCAEAVLAGHAEWIFLTGGIGAGTADLRRPEADVFRDSLKLWFPSLDPRRILVENRSTNTAENIRFLREISEAAGLRPLLRRRGVILVATPVRMRRVLLTWKKLEPDIPAVCWAPPVDWREESLLYAARGMDLETQMRNECERLVSYPAKGWIAKPRLPDGFPPAGISS